MKLLLITALMLAASLSAGQQSQGGDANLPEDIIQHVVHAEDIEWRPCPENLPPGCEIAVLEGSPRTPDLFTVRLRLGENFVMPPHTHPKHERVTVLSGQIVVAFDVNGKREDAKRFGPRDYYVNASGTVHSVWIDELSELQVTGFGPWETHFVE